MKLNERIIDNSIISNHNAIIPTNLICRSGVTQFTDNEKHIAGLAINNFPCVMDKLFTYTKIRYKFPVEGELFKLTVKNTEQ